MVEMKVLLALAARHYSFVCDNNTEWTQAIGKVPKVGRSQETLHSMTWHRQLRYWDGCF
jgi:hypothetical protein